MSDAPRSGARSVAAFILLAVGAANLGYAAYRASQGMEGNLPLIVAGIVSATLAVILLAARKRG